MLLHKGFEAHVTHAKADGHAQAPQVGQLRLHRACQLEQPHPRNGQQRSRPRLGHELASADRVDEGHEDNLARADEGALVGAGGGERDCLGHVATRDPRAALRAADEQLAVVPAREGQQRDCGEREAYGGIVGRGESSVEDRLDHGEVGRPEHGKEQHGEARAVGAERGVHLREEAALGAGGRILACIHGDHRCAGGRRHDKRRVQGDGGRSRRLLRVDRARGARGPHDGGARAKRQLGASRSCGRAHRLPQGRRWRRQVRDQ
mmetsp:Transcript_23272/g.59070  ORF Transcript_23272/g.59070 Transcript_23272/m.59070 type:complete len:263 (+) Transcript_23272:564-1352(+)